MQAIANGKDDKKIETTRCLITLFASANGIADEAEIIQSTKDIRAFMDDSAAGNSRLNDMCAIYGHGLRIFDLALNMPTKKSYLEATLDEKQCAATVAFGMEAIAGGADVLAVGAAATASDIVAASLILVLCPETADIIKREMTADFELITKIASSCDTAKPLETLAKIGGRENAAIIGAIIAARSEHVTIILDDLSALAAALILNLEAPSLTTHCRLAICQTELMAEILQKTSIQQVMQSDSPKLYGANSALAMGVLKANAAAQ